MMMAPLCGHGMMTQKGTSRNSCLVPYTLQPFKALTPEGKPFEGHRDEPSEWNQGLSVYPTPPTVLQTTPLYATPAHYHKLRPLKKHFHFLLSPPSDKAYESYSISQTAEFILFGFPTFLKHFNCDIIL